MSGLTVGQRQVLEALRDGPKTAREVEALRHGEFVFAPDETERIRYHLRRAEDAGFVRRVWREGAKAARWELTYAGHNALADGRGTTGDRVAVASEVPKPPEGS